ncbi:uncharacterized protein LOC110981768 [Acanthaster planci]|uniref:Uncharacterized protein LOC110981768 n=1 Tax=Acanthaster planci TaxID=133434 RepID=A0A8B7YRM5_ACAPL|nr:uncharacterized protein LOC110981768 [Acanthaster planci]
MARFGLIFIMCALTCFVPCKPGVVLRKEYEISQGKGDGGKSSIQDIRTGGHFLSMISEQALKLDPPKIQTNFGAWLNTDNEGPHNLEDSGYRLAEQYRDKRASWPWWKNSKKKKGASGVRNKWRSQKRGRPTSQVAEEDDNDDSGCSDSSSSEEDESEIRTLKRNPRPWTNKRRGSWGRGRGGGNSFNRDDDDEERRRKRRPSKRCKTRNGGKGLSTASTETQTTATVTESTTTMTATTTQPSTTTAVLETTQAVETTQILTRSASQSPAPDPLTEKQESTLEPTTEQVTSTTETPSTTIERTTTSVVKTLGIDPEPK